MRTFAYDYGDWIVIASEDGTHEWDARIEWGQTAEDALNCMGYLVPYGWDPCYSRGPGTVGPRKYAVVESAY